MGYQFYCEGCGNTVDDERADLGDVVVEYHCLQCDRSVGRCCFDEDTELCRDCYMFEEEENA